jgi:colanic acid/amylovoran biosynthesis protein
VVKTLRASRPRILISHVYSSGNNGDAALLAVEIAELRRVFDRPDLRVSTADPAPPGTEFRGVPVEPSLMYLALNTLRSRPAKLLYSAWVVGLTVLAALVWRLTGVLPLPRRLRRATRAILDADLMAPVGGGYLRGRPGIASSTELVLLLHPILLAKLAGVPVMHYSQSIGPFGNSLQRRLAGCALRRLDLLLVREDVTLDTLRPMRVPPGTVVRAVDGGFLFAGGSGPAVADVVDLEPGRPVIGVTVREWLAGPAQARYERAVAELCEHIVDTGAEVVFVPQVTAVHHGDDDRIASRRVADLVRRDRHVHVITGSYDCDQIKALYGSLQLAVGTRFHSVIFSLTALVPALAIEYEHKTGGIMKDLGLSEWVRDIADVTGAQLIELYDQLVLCAEDYRGHLARVLPAYVQRAHLAADEIGSRYRALVLAHSPKNLTR